MVLLDVFRVYEYILAKEVGRWSHEGPIRVGVRLPPGRASLPRGRLVASLTSTPSLLDCVCSKNDPREGFIPFDIPFLRNTEIGKKKQQFALGLWLVG